MEIIVEAQGPSPLLLPSASDGLATATVTSIHRFSPCNFSCYHKMQFLICMFISLWTFMHINWFSGSVISLPVFFDGEDLLCVGNGSVV
jgi:hypothetical protein